MDIGLPGRLISGPGKQRQPRALLELAKVGVIVYVGCQFDTHDEGVSIKEWPPSEWLVGMSVGQFLDC